MLDLNKKIILKNNKVLEIDKPSVEHAQKIVSFLNSAGGESDFLTFGVNEFPLSIQEEELSIQESLKSNRTLMLVGKIDQEIVSQLYLDRTYNTRTSHIGEVAVSVKKELWGNSIGTHMMLTSISWARENGITKLHLYVRVDNDAAINLYKKLGFVIEGQISRAVKVNGHYHDNYIMGLVLD